ncbi:Fumarate and nitrate reduction regulatory protein [Paraglaciecola mesophila]|uniref:Fumarate and nitrate reduction regulatory protein n=1 Tax=Paraglaciecola mesophila TaxID=197222 RepID=A0A857JE09_9ALTE|nr:helix-turn-helix domain-containing protein [Paraglaciecola mesophila]QHJ10269.1 Fumarate and nitrate reduction regulatory protein [Paraglaciecola mesophila]
MSTSHCKSSPTCEYCALSRNCTENINSTSAMQKVQVLTHKIYHKGDTLFCAGNAFNALYIMRSGSAKASTMTFEADEQIVDFYFPGDLLGTDGFAHKLHAHNVTFLETSSVCYISLNAVNALVAHSEVGRQQLLSTMSLNTLNQQQQLMNVHSMTSIQRLTRFLLDLSLKLAKRGLSSQQLTLSMTRIDIANYLGMAIETVSRLLTSMQQQGLIHVQRRQITLLNMPEMNKICLSDPFSQTAGEYDVMQHAMLRSATEYPLSGTNM